METNTSIFEQDNLDKSLINLLTPNNDLDWEIISEKHYENEPSYWYLIYNNIKVKTLEKINNLDCEIISRENYESNSSYLYLIYNNIKVKTLEKINNLELNNLELNNYLFNNVQDDTQ